MDLGLYNFARQGIHIHLTEFTIWRDNLELVDITMAPFVKLDADYLAAKAIADEFHDFPERSRRSFLPRLAGTIMIVVILLVAMVCI